RSVTAMPVSERPQTIVTQCDGAGFPRCDIDPMTIDAESALVTKKMTMESIAISDVIAPNGSSASTRKRMSWLSSAAEIAPLVCSSHIDVPPKIPNQIRQTNEGTMMTTVTNSRS